MATTTNSSTSGSPGAAITGCHHHRVPITNQQLRAALAPPPSPPPSPSSAAPPRLAVAAVERTAAERAAVEIKFVSKATGAVLKLTIDGNSAQHPVPVTSHLSGHDFNWMRREFKRLNLPCPERSYSFDPKAATTGRRTRTRHHRDRLKTVRCE